MQGTFCLKDNTALGSHDDHRKSTLRKYEVIHICIVRDESNRTVYKHAYITSINSLPAVKCCIRVTKSNRYPSPVIVRQSISTLRSGQRNHIQRGRPAAFCAGFKTHPFRILHFWHSFGNHYHFSNKIGQLKIIPHESACQVAQ